VTAGIEAAIMLLNVGTYTLMALMISAMIFLNNPHGIACAVGG
jgi:hypothetical protein